MHKHLREEGVIASPQQKRVSLNLKRFRNGLMDRAEVDSNSFFLLVELNRSHPYVVDR